MDFITPRHTLKRRASGDIIEVFPEFRVARSKDLMIRGGSFYAIWDEQRTQWSTDEYDVQTLVDNELVAYSATLDQSSVISIKNMRDFSTGSWSKFKLFVSKLGDNSHQLNTKVVFSNQTASKKDYSSIILDYPLIHADTPSFDFLFETLYDKDNLDKIKWAIGSVIAGDSLKIQKFYVFYGGPGTGKSTVLNLIQKMFEGYCNSFEAASLVSTNNKFSSEMFRDNPLIGINHEGDLSKTKDNSLLSSIVGHDTITMNVKNISAYSMKIITTLFIASNKPVFITDAKSGIIRRLVDIRPTGITVPVGEYDRLVGLLDFELGGIAHKCLQFYKERGPAYYSTYKPVDMMLRTNPFLNFIDENYFEFSKVPYITLARAWEMYREFCTSNGLEYKLTKPAFRDEFKNYWKTFSITKRVETIQHRSVYEDFDESSFESKIPMVRKDSQSDWLDLKNQKSILDSVLGDQLFQYMGDGIILRYWDKVKSKLSTANTSKTHLVLPPGNMVVIDFDIRDESGDKSLERNVEAASLWPSTYAEVSKSGQGLHLHYYYDGDVSALSRVYDLNIEIIPAIGNTSIRRKLSLCNNIPITTINSGLPLKEIKPMVSDKVIKSERALRILITRILHKEIHPHTKPSIDFLDKVLKQSHNSGLSYDVSNMKGAIIDFAANSTNNHDYCISVAMAMSYMSDEEHIDVESDDSDIVFFDIESFPNLVIVSWKRAGPGNKTQIMYNPTPELIEPLMSYRLIGFNNRRYDNHMLWAILLGYSVYDVNKLSQSIVKEGKGFFRQAYGLSHADGYEYLTDKKSLKQWQIDLGLRHIELDLPWEDPVSPELWEKVGEYCANDTESLEVIHDRNIGDYIARLIVSELSGLKPNDSTESHLARIIFGSDKNPQKYFVYTDLAQFFPGYTFTLEDGKWVSKYKEEIVGEGGWVFARPGSYTNVGYYDVNSMHPSSLIRLNLFGKNTPKYTAFKDARLLIKHKLLDEASEMFDGVLKKYLTSDESTLKSVDKAMKLVLNRIYGLTFASYDSVFKDDRNVDNIVAKRGSLFMIDLKNYLESIGIEVIHIKTDSVKVLNDTTETLDILNTFSQPYGYTFSKEGCFEKVAIINDTDLIGKFINGPWDATGARFSKPVVFKKLFSKEPLVIKDFQEVRAVKKGVIYLDFGDESNRVFIGRVGAFVPVKSGGGTLYRYNEGKDYAVTDTKGYLWLPSDMVTDINDIDTTYHFAAVDKAIDKLESVGCDLSTFSD